MSFNDSGSEYSYYSYSSAGYAQRDVDGSAPRYASSIHSYAASSSASQASGHSSGSGSQRYYTHTPVTGFSYDEYRMPQTYSDTPPPSTHTALSTFHRGVQQQQTAALPSRRMLHCEFQPWTGCQQQFRLDDVGAWIRHAEDEHLQRMFPTECICWFCDDIVFSTQRCSDAGLNFTQRMEHIAGHIMDGDHFEHRRPDFHYLDHVYRVGKISRQAFELARGASEGPRTSGVLHPAGWRPASREAAIVVTGGGRRRPRERRS
ncbi:hypothetical protein CH063_05552 [Colletotrichum higginsianum]|uniref:Uncharacterized protein n=2 Tax=Colletotrichum destructivum species complex TaxID=2707350 RepID=H1UZD9_COLHI|nr:uncharacterized protein CH63R_10087 [Colletotrichum higginsianum IMI 349063]OBR05967.1 hypothetical protein CH63R_10087 [Colletotrichum higginsianum IMI 349063]CCF33340.1 hypothetical protein CH063_05552 [Colletotrichum higginsianum]